jgi:hypothetical protein
MVWCQPVGADNPPMSTDLVFLVTRGIAPRPASGCVHPPAGGTKIHVLRRDRLGGLIHEYAQAA